MKLDGRLILVTGAGGNLGAAACRMLLASGARVCAVGHDSGQLASLCAGIDGIDTTAPDSPLLCVVAELTDSDAVARAFDEAQERFGPVWGVLCAAGGWRGGAPVSETSDEILSGLISMNLVTCFNTAREGMKRMKASGKGGRIVTVASHNAFTGTGGAGSGAYVATKAAVLALTKVLAEEGAAHGILANCIAPQTLRTPENEAAMPSADPSRWVSLGEAALTACMLLSPELGSASGGVLPLPNRGKHSGS